MATELIVSIISIIIVLGMFALMVWSHRVHYGVGGLMLIGIGILMILHMNKIISFNISEYPVVHFAVYFMIVFAGKDLLKEGFKEESGLKYPSIILGIVLIVLTTIPTLNKFEVIEFGFPEYPLIIDAIIYIVSGMFLLIGIFTLLAKKEI